MLCYLAVSGDCYWMSLDMLLINYFFQTGTLGCNFAMMISLILMEFTFPVHIPHHLLIIILLLTIPTCQSCLMTF